MPLLDRAQRMMIRALDRLEARWNGKPTSTISIGSAGQVNVGSAVSNDIGQCCSAELTAVSRFSIVRSLIDSGDHALEIKIGSGV